MRKISVFLLALMLSLGAVAKEEEHGGGGHDGGETKEGEAAAPALEYLPLEPPLVVNLQGQKRYLKADVQLLIEGAENLKRIKEQMPVIRHALILLMSERDPATLANGEEREKLRAATLNEIRAALEKYSNSEGLKDVFFANFLVQ
ncbi:MAG TPA: flagellar basal body-associated FliL family protein [Methylococcaceae bacterium]|nr:flagellar basal body-associated FliL family protein [Methylococcaceae bacterium]